MRHDDHQGNDRGAGPTGKLVNAETGPGRQEHKFHGQQWDAVPAYLPEEGQKNAGKDSGLKRPPLGQNKLAGSHHSLVMGGQARDLQAHVGFHGGAEFTAVAVPDGPTAVGQLPGQKIRGHPGHLGLVQTQEAVEHEVFCGNGNVGFQLGPPVPIRVLELHHSGGGPLHCLLEPALRTCGSQGRRLLARRNGVPPQVSPSVVFF